MATVDRHIPQLPPEVGIQGGAEAVENAFLDMQPSYVYSRYKDTYISPKRSSVVSDEHAPSREKPTRMFAEPATSSRP